MSFRGAELHLAAGSVRISTNKIQFPPEFEYGKNEPFLKVFVLSYVKFICDSPLESETSKPLRVYMAFYKRLTTEKISGIISEFSGYANQLLQSELVTGAEASTRPFLSSMRDTPIFREYHTWWKTGRPDLLKFVLSFLRFGKKLEYEDPQMDAVAFREWREVEERLRTLTFKDEDTASLRTIIQELIGPLLIDSLVPKFGPGKVAEGSKASDTYGKLRNLYLDRKLEYAFNRIRPFRGSDEGFGSLRAISTGGSVSDSTARLKFVPKDISKSRSICMEPNSYMYFQQGVLRWMIRSMERSPISRFVNLRDQANNREAAIHGSMYLSSDTIDLSSASDSVSAELVKAVFPPDWLFYMFATRSSDVLLPDGSRTKVLKFAPMGSALCFPTQCIVFTAVCIYAYAARYHGKTTGSWRISREEAKHFIRQLPRTRSEDTPFKRRFEPPVVYGDDIIVDTRLTDDVVSLLSRLGFKVNLDKSFIGGQAFRESCGVYACEGHDVTPVIFRLPFLKEGKWDASVYASIIGGINQMSGNGYKAVATFWLSLLKGYGFKYPLPFVEDANAFGIFTRNKHRAKLEGSQFYRWNADWQVNEERVQGIGPRKLDGQEPENAPDYLLDQWWRSRMGGSSPTDFRGRLSIRPQETRLVPRWTRCE